MRPYELADRLRGEAGLHVELTGQATRLVGMPVVRQFAEHGCVLGLFAVRLLLKKLLLHRCDLGRGIGADALRVALVQRRRPLDAGVAARLGDGGVIHLGVPVAPVANQVNHHVRGKRGAIFRGNLRNAHDGIGVLSVDVEDGDGQALGDVGGVARRVGFLRLRSEAQQVVDHHLDGSADLVPGDGRKVQRLCPDALAGKRGVAVDDHGQDLCLATLVFPTVVQAHLPGTRAAHHNGVHSLKVRGIAGQVERDRLAARRGVGAGRALVVLHVAATQVRSRIDILKLGEDLRGAAAHGIHHDVEPATVAHRKGAALHAKRGGRLRRGDPGRG